MDKLEVVEIKEVDLALVEEPSHVLRPVDRDTDKFRALVRSMQDRGFDKGEPIEVYDSGAGTFIVGRKGMHRYNAAAAANLRKVWVGVLNRAPTESELVSGQVQAEATHTEARPAEFGRAVLKYMQFPENRGKTKVQVAADMGRRDPGFLDKVLKLATLPEAAQKLVDDDKISMANGLALVAAARAGIPIDEDLLRKARVEGAASFEALVASMVQALRAGPRAKKTPPARLRDAKDVRREYEIATKMSSGAHPEYIRALQWVLRLDPVSVAAEGFPAQGAPAGATAGPAQAQAAPL